MTLTAADMRRITEKLNAAGPGRNGEQTLEWARALPEIEDEMFVTVTRLLLGPEAKAMGVFGDMVKERHPRAFCPVPVTGNMLIAFIDADGRRMKVVHTAEDGWCKVELHT